MVQHFVRGHKQALLLRKSVPPLVSQAGRSETNLLLTWICIAIFNWGSFLNPVQHMATQMLGLAQGGRQWCRGRKESGKWDFFSVLAGKALSIHETTVSPKTPLCFGEFSSPSQIFFSSLKQDSPDLEIRVEEMLYPFVLENVLQRKVLLFLAGDELEESFHPGNCDHQISHLEVIRW